MKNRIGTLRNWNRLNIQPNQNLALLPDKEIILADYKPRIASEPSRISIIITRLISESTHNAMLVRLQNKLGKSEEEIFKMIAEL